MSIKAWCFVFQYSGENVSPFNTNRKGSPEQAFFPPPMRDHMAKS